MASGQGGGSVFFSIHSNCIVLYFTLDYIIILLEGNLLKPSNPYCGQLTN